MSFRFARDGVAFVAAGATSIGFDARCRSIYPLQSRLNGLYLFDERRAFRETLKPYLLTSAWRAAVDQSSSGMEELVHLNLPSSDAWRGAEVLLRQTSFAEGTTATARFDAGRGW